MSSDFGIEMSFSKKTRNVEHVTLPLSLRKPNLENGAGDNDFQTSTIQLCFMLRNIGAIFVGSVQNRTNWSCINCRVTIKLYS